MELATIVVQRDDQQIRTELVDDAHPLRSIDVVDLQAPR
jgi:hypothetical protein